MRIIHIMSGLPASGKSTYCEKHGRENGDIVVHRDEVRAILREKFNSKEVFPCSAEYEYQYFVNYLTETINGTEKDVWIDQTTLSNGAALKLLFALDRNINLNDFIICFEVMYTPIKICITRDEKRSGYEHVTENTICDMNKGFNISLRKILLDAPSNINNRIFMKNHYYREENNE